MKYNISVIIDAVFQSNVREGIFTFSSDKIDEAIDIAKNLTSEMLSFPEKEVNEESLKKKFSEEGFHESIYYGKKMHAINWLNLGYKSDVGRVRELDEDSIVILTVETKSGRKISRNSLFVLGDGVGGHTKGEVASYMGTKTVAEELIKCMLSISERDDIEMEKSIRDSIKKANELIYDHVKIHPEYGGMATTIVAALIKNNKLFVGNVGDSRAYIINDGISQITTDHSLVQEMVAAGKITQEQARNHAQKNMVTRVVGYFRDIDVDVFEEDIYKEDTIMLCCDGLSDLLRNDEIKDIILKTKDLTKACNSLVEMANERGGPDNISVILSRSNYLPNKIPTQEIPSITVVAPRRKILVPIAISITAMILLLLLGLYFLNPMSPIPSPVDIKNSIIERSLYPNETVNAKADQAITQLNWYPDNASVALNINSPVLMNAGQSSLFTLNVSNTNAGTYHVNVIYLIFGLPTGQAESIITIEPNVSGNARWTMEKHIPQTKPEINEWEASIKSGRDISKYKNIAEFKDMISLFRSTAQNFSNGSMKIEEVNISYGVTQSGSGGFGIVRYSFSWINFSRRDIDKIFIGDGFPEGFALSSNSVLVVKIPESYEFESASPGFDKQVGNILIWDGSVNHRFGKGEPSIVLQRTLFTIPGTSITSNIPGKSGLSSALLVLLVILIAAGAVILFWKKKS